MSLALLLALGSLPAGAADLVPSIDADGRTCVADPAAPTLPAWQALGHDAWWLPGAAGDSQADNRGGISNLLAVKDDRQGVEPSTGRDEGRLWLIGSGPSPAYGRALATSLRCELGRAPTDVIAPWSRPELVLGSQALGGDGAPAPRRWGHADVVAAMAERCPRCIERLRLRLGERSGDLDGTQVEHPTQVLSGPSGAIGPLHWWRVPRGDTVLTIWWHPPSGTITGHGLLWSDGAPDLRDTDIAAMQAALDAVDVIVSAIALASQRGLGGEATVLRWLPEQGPITPSNETRPPLPEQHRRYWAALRDAVERAQAEGKAETLVVTDLPGVDPTWSSSPRHALNWQRAWRQAEDAWTPAATVPAQRAPAPAP